MIRAFVVLALATVVLSGLIVSGNWLLAKADGGERRGGPATLRRLDDGSKVLSYDLSGNEVLVYVVDDIDGCRAYAIAGPSQRAVTMDAGTSVSFTLTDPAGEADTRDWMLEEEC